MANSKKPAAPAVPETVGFASLSDLAFKHGQADSKIGEMASYCLDPQRFGIDFPKLKLGDKNHADKFEELSNGYLSYWATLNPPKKYIILDRGSVATWVLETDENRDAKGERYEVSAHFVMSLSPQQFGKFRTGTAEASTMPKAWQEGFFAIAKRIRDSFSTYRSGRITALQRKATELLNPMGEARTRAATVDMGKKIKDQQASALKSCKVAKTGRGDVTAHPDRMELGFELFNAVYFSNVPVDTVRIEFNALIKRLSQ